MKPTPDQKYQDKKFWVILAAAGTGTRFGAPIPKQFIPIAGGSLLQNTIMTFASFPGVQGMIVVVPPGWDSREGVLPEHLIPEPTIQIVEGKDRRGDSVRAGFECLPQDSDLVLVHDAVRPRVSRDLIRRVVLGAWTHGACIPLCPVTDTVKEVDEAGKVVRTLDRERLRLAQTPQGFRREVLQQAYAWSERSSSMNLFTDEAALVAASGQQVISVGGETTNLKVTEPADLLRLTPMVPRVGHGYDVHRLVVNRKLVLGGVEIPYSLGLEGHSDADAALHALCDAMLGAAGLGDIGRFFPNTDPKYRGISSIVLLREVVERIRQAGWRVSSADMTLIAEKPKLAEYLPQMIKILARELQIEPSAVGIKASKDEGLGFTGRLEGIAAHAIAVLVPAGP